MALAPHIFREYDIRGIVGRDFGPEVSEPVGRAFGSLVREQTGKDRGGPASAGWRSGSARIGAQDAALDFEP